MGALCETGKNEIDHSELPQVDLNEFSTNQETGTKKARGGNLAVSTIDYDPNRITYFRREGK